MKFQERSVDDYVGHYHLAKIPSKSTSSMILELETGSSDDNLQIYYKVLTLEATKLTVFQAFEVGQEPKSKRC